MTTILVTIIVTAATTSYLIWFVVWWQQRRVRPLPAVVVDNSSVGWYCAGGETLRCDEQCDFCKDFARQPPEQVALVSEEMKKLAERLAGKKKQLEKK